MVSELRGVEATGRNLEDDVVLLSMNVRAMAGCGSTVTEEVPLVLAGIQTYPDTFALGSIL